MKTYKQIALIAAGILMLAGSSFSGPASAQEGTAGQRTACMSDAFRYCSEDIPDVAKIEACLLQNRERLHPACQAQFGSEAGQTQPARYR
jgi:hypothetical protein